MKTVAVINQKGGVGKTTTALALGSGLAARGKKVLFVDLDPQGNLGYALAADPGRPGAMELLTGADPAGTIQAAPGGTVAAASLALAGADAVLTATGKEYRLREGLAALAQDYDYAVIDTPPALGVLTVNALTAADGAVVPAQADVFSLQGIGQLGLTVEAVRQYCNPSLKILGIVLTRHHPRSILGRDLAEAAAEAARRLGARLFKAPIREAVAVREAKAERRDLVLGAPRSKAAEDYRNFIAEFLKFKF
ncbi:MAG: ParA family protein [Clostridium sp.]|nr:ParA family protein [Clostridium sp.]